jgi:hypothetical protein
VLAEIITKISSPGLGEPPQVTANQQLDRLAVCNPNFAWAAPIENKFTLPLLGLHRRVAAQTAQGRAARKAAGSDGACRNGISQFGAASSDTRHPAKTFFATRIFQHRRNRGSYGIQSYA